MLLKDKRLTSAIRLFNQAYGHYKPQIIVLSVLGFLSGILEGIGINAVIPLFSFVTGDGSAPSDAISQYIYRGLTILHIPYSLPVMLTLIGILFVIKGLLTHVVNYIMAVIGATYERDLRNNLFRSTLEAQWPYLIKQKIGYLEKVLMTDINNSSSLLGFISGAILTATSLAIYIVIALNISVTTTLATLAVGLVLFLVFKPLMYKIRKISEKYAAITKQVAHFVNQNMIGIKTVKSFSLEDKVGKHGSYAFEELRGQRVKIATMRSLATVFMEPIGIIFICGVFGAAFYLSPNFNFASFAVIIYLIHKIFTYTQKAQKGLHDINELIPYLRSAMQFQENADQEKEHGNGGGKLVFNQKCELNDISFGYANDHMILDHVSLHVQKGDMLGIIGPSGAGKTTLVDLMLRLYEPQSGQILIDGTPLKNISLKVWRQSIGYMSQDVFLLNASVSDNIKFYDTAVSDDEIKEAARLAHIDEFIESQPQGYETVVGERGMMVSEGQKQRIVLARVLARKPKLLLLDEATSALDNESELAIRKALDDLKGTVTMVMIAHRLATIMSCDRLIAIDNGKIIEEGSPEALMEKKNSYFYKTYHLND